MEHVINLAPNEPVQLNADQLGTLYQQLGEVGAEDIICRAMEELAHRLQRCRSLFQDGDIDALRKQLRLLIAIADQIGMRSLSDTADHVITTVDRRDSIAVAATLGRLLRVGERSLHEIWDLEDLSI